jgi:hypothetical protein
MGINLFIYTHTSYSDVWIPLFDSIKTYLPDAKITVALNEPMIIEGVDNLITYDENLPYTERLYSIMESMDDEPFIFMHEDMFLYDYPRLDLIEKYFEYVKEGLAKSIKLIPVGTTFYQTDFDSTLHKTEFSKFSIQPTVTNRKSIFHFLSSVKNLNIWEFEAQMQNEEGCFVTAFGNEKKIGIFHYESLIFPYIATAIVKGKWNMSEYPILEEILQKHKIDKNIRGIA